VERVLTGGAGSGTFKPISGQESAPNSFEGAASVILTPDRRFLFATNGGANSVSSFAVDEDGRLTLLDVQPVPRRRFPSERHRQITSLLSFEANALRVALVRP
jgi:6-phosphogluconolactonase (cycloisomerase 2 family)